MVWLTASNARRAAAVRVFADWPATPARNGSLAESGGPPQPRPVVEVIHPRRADQGHAYQRRPDAAAPLGADPEASKGAALP